MFDLHGRVAIVTGGGNGIGRHLAHGLAERGASVVIADIAGDDAERVAEEVSGFGVKSLGLRIDVCRSEDVDRLVEETVHHLGTVDILVNNAGGTGGRSGAADTLPLDDWQYTMDLTATSVFLCSQRAGRVMIRQNYGKIINIASVYGMVGHHSQLYDRRPDGRLFESPAYAAAKGAIVNLTRDLACYWGKYNITVNAIAPGMVRTERLAVKHSPETWQRLSHQIPLGRPAKPEDMKGAVVFFASPASDYVTGQILAVDGGWLAW